MSSVRLADFENSWFSAGRSTLWQALWYFVGLPLLRCPLLPSSALRVSLLRMFGAEIGNGVVIKPGVRVKFPWRLEVGDHCWIGEDAWIDNLAPVILESNVCVSQGAYLCTGNHDWRDPAFGLIVKPITLRSGSWVGARAVVAPGAVLEECAIAAAGSVVHRSIPRNEIHAGNPAQFTKYRTLEDKQQAVSFR